MLEKQLEKMFVKAVRDAGGQAIKITAPQWAGIPDRLILLPGGKHGFVELKAPGRKPRPQQVYRLQTLASLGHYATVLDHPDHIQEIIHEIQTTQLPKTRY